MNAPFDPALAAAAHRYTEALRRTAAKFERLHDVDAVAAGLFAAAFLPLIGKLDPRRAAEEPLMLADELEARTARLTELAAEVDARIEGVN